MKTKHKALNKIFHVQNVHRIQCEIHVSQTLAASGNKGVFSNDTLPDILLKCRGFSMHSMDGHLNTMIFKIVHGQVKSVW